jgi:hypothetical protein
MPTICFVPYGPSSDLAFNKCQLRLPGPYKVSSDRSNRMPPSKIKKREPLFRLIRMNDKLMQIWTPCFPRAGPGLVTIRCSSDSIISGLIIHLREGANFRKETGLYPWENGEWLLLQSNHNILIRIQIYGGLTLYEMWHSGTCTRTQLYGVKQ